MHSVTEYIEKETRHSRTGTHHALAIVTLRDLFEVKAVIFRGRGSQLAKTSKSSTLIFKGSGGVILSKSKVLIFHDKFSFLEGKGRTV